MKQLRILVLLLLAGAFLLPEAKAQTATYTWSGNVSAVNTANNPTTGTGQLDVHGNVWSVTSGDLLGTNEGSLSFYRDFLNFSAVSSSATQTYVVTGVAGTGTGMGVAGFYNPSTNDSYAIYAVPGSNYATIFKITGNPASSYTPLTNTTASNGVMNGSDQYQLVVTLSYASSTTTITMALYDLTNPAAAQPTDPIVTNALGAVGGTLTYVDSSSPLTSGNFALVTQYAATAEYSKVRIWNSIASGPQASMLDFYTVSTPTATISASGVSINPGTSVAGTSPYSYQWYRSQTSGFTPGGGNILSGKTSSTITDTAAVPSVANFYKCVVTDSATPTAATATSVQVPATPASSVFDVGFIGDSRTAGYLASTYTGWIGQISVSAGGSGYAASSVLPLTITGSGGGSGAVGFAVTNSSGVVTNAYCTQHGSGYNNGYPTFAITTPGSGSGATFANASGGAWNGAGGMPMVAEKLLQCATGNNVAYCLNEGISGSTSGQWLTSTTYYADSVLAFGSPSTTPLVVYNLGVNDAKETSPVSAATFSSNVSNTVNALVAAGYKVLLIPPFYTVPSYPQDVSGTFDEASDGYLLQYAAAEQTLAAANPTHIYYDPSGDAAYWYFANHTSELADGLHPNDTGYISWARLVYSDICSVLKLTTSAVGRGRTLK
jgi:lysophospholipase L1-like esterase